MYVPNRGLLAQLHHPLHMAGTTTNKVVTRHSLGDLSQIVIWTDSADADWYVESVVVTSIETETVWHFPTFRWIRASLASLRHLRIYYLHRSLRNLRIYYLHRSLTRIVL